MRLVFTESDRSVYSKEECVDRAAEALARCYARLDERDETETAPAEARAV